jgi:protein-S-isoprenylcysteine O-methyltransferase Ste14
LRRVIASRAMLQIIGLLLCVYLVFKGVEIFQIVYVTDRKWNEMPWLLGLAALVASIVLAALFAWLLIESGQQIGTQVPRLP